jgi:mannosyltransferase OCH1-like enzyme
MDVPTLVIKEIPFVSCLCVTQNKFELLSQSIDCFLFQSHPLKELVIVYESNNPWIAEAKAQYESDTVRFIEVPIEPKKTLGELRNISVAEARGEYIMQWDDDDMYHPDRIRLQVGLASRGSACGNVVNSVVIYDQKLQRAFLFNNYKFDGSILVHKQTFLDKVTYPSQNRSEDSVVRNALLSDGSIVPLMVPFMYLYRFHTKNTWDENHFHGLYSRSVPLDQATTRLVAAANFLADPAFLKIALQAAAMGKKPVFPTTVSKILHQSWSKRDLAPHSAELTAGWKALHPGWTYKLWTDEECLAFVSAVYPEFLARYKSFPYAIQRFDAVRYLILHTYGGVYLDLDMLPLKTLTFLETCNEFVLSKEPAEAAAIHGRDFIVSNAFMASPPQHKFIQYLIQDMLTHVSSFKDRNTHILDTTGPFFMSRVYKRRSEGVRLLHPAYFMPLSYKEVDACVSASDSVTFYKKAASAYGVHLFEGSWWRPQREKPLYSVSLPRLTGGSPIPKVLHLTWKTKELPSAFNDLVSKMRALHPEWTVNIWTDQEMLDFVKERGEPHRYQKYSDYTKTIQCCDYFRVFVLYVLGGVYLDLDIDLDCAIELPEHVTAFFPCEKVMSSVSLVQHKNRDAVRIGNYAMGSVPGHPFFKYFLDRLQSAKSNDVGPNWILETTGPGILTTSYHDYVKAGGSDVTVLYPNLDSVPHCTCQSIDGVVSCRVGPFGSHLHAGTWRS